MAIGLVGCWDLSFGKVPLKLVFMKFWTFG